MTIFASGTLLNTMHWLAGIPAAGEQYRVLEEVGALPQPAAPRDTGPEPGQDGSVGAVKGDREQASNVHHVAGITFHQ